MQSMEKSENIIRTEHLNFSYLSENGGEAVPAIFDVSLNIKRGSFVAFVGRNGSGKSTIAKNFNALLLPTGGAVLVNGMDTSDDNTVWDVRQTVGMVFQNPDNQLVSSIVEDDVAFGPENLGVDPKEIRRRVDDALTAVDMYEHRKKGPHLLSGGQKQRVAIAGVLAMEPDCIVFDEPTAMLDPKGRQEIMNIILRLHAEGKTVVLITHFMEEAAMADRIVVMHKGRLVLDGAPTEVFENGRKLEELHLDMPFAVKLAELLRKDGLPVPHQVITEDDLVKFLCE